jgi:hypothetical protein
MKKIILTLILNLFIISLFGQDYSKLSNETFKSPQSYKNGEEKVLECSNFILNNPYNKNDLNRLNALQYILKWMEGTPDYTFSIGEESMKLTKGKPELMSIYFAAMVKIVLENPDLKSNNNEIQQKAKEKIVEYCSNSENGIKPTKEIKKILKQRRK